MSAGEAKRAGGGVGRGTVTMISAFESDMKARVSSIRSRNVHLKGPVDEEKSSGLGGVSRWERSGQRLSNLEESFALV